MNWTDLQRLLQRHAIDVSLRDKLVVTCATAVPAEVLNLISSHAEILKERLRTPSPYAAELPHELKSFLLRVAHQGTGIPGTVRLPGGVVTNFDEYILANATTYLVQPSPHLLRILQDAYDASPTPTS